MITQLMIMSILCFPPLSGTQPQEDTPNKGSLTAIFQVVDGDTLRAGKPGTQRFRLLRLDAPERFTEDGKRATAAMKKLVAGKEIKCIWQKKDKYRRPLVDCWTSVDGVNISDEMLKVDGVTVWQ